MRPHFATSMEKTPKTYLVDDLQELVGERLPSAKLLHRRDLVMIIRALAKAASPLLRGEKP